MLFNLKKNFLLGLKKSYSISFLPSKLEKIYSSIFIRILRVIGGFCLALVITGRYTIFYKELHILIFTFAIIQSILIMCISLIKFFYGLYLIIYKPELFEVRNSPLNNFASHLARVISCARIGCGAAVGTTGVLAAAVTYDTILEATGREKVFVPMIAKFYNDIFGEPMTPENYKNLKEGLSVLPAPENFDVDKFDKEFEKLSPAEKKSFS